MRAGSIVSATILISTSWTACSLKSRSETTGITRDEPVAIRTECAQDESEDASSSPLVDPGSIATAWLEPRPDVYARFLRTEYLPPESVVGITTESYSKAVRLLERQAWRVLTHEEMTSLAERPITGTGPGVFVLLRGVEMLQEKPTTYRFRDGFRVRVKDGIVTVVAQGGRFDVEDYRPHPVIALLRSEPEQTFVLPLYSICLPGDYFERGR
jgi:hypothetical protein